MNPIMPTEKLLQLLKEITEEKIPFNKLIGMKIETLDLDKIGIRLEMPVSYTHLTLPTILLV